MPVNDVDRRTLIAGSAAALGLAVVTRPARAAIPEGFERFALWPGEAPGGEHVTVTEAEVPRSPNGPKTDTAFTHVTRPTLTVLRPQRPNGAALLLIPGGGYRRVAIGHEGYAIARRFAEAGFTCFILLYRLPADGWAAGHTAPLQDAQRGLRLIRQRAGGYGLDPEKTGVIGFSAGGHLAAWLATHAHVESYHAIDAADALSARPKVAGLLYPVILMEGAHVHRGSREQLLGAAPSPESLRACAMDTGVTAATPPTFLAHALDDSVVPPENSLAMLASLRRAGVPAECHLLETGGHGFGLSLPDRTPSPWPELFRGFAARHGLA